MSAAERLARHGWESASEGVVSYGWDAIHTRDRWVKATESILDALRADPGLAAEALGGELGTEVSVRSADGVTSQRHVIRLPWGAAS